MAVVTPGLQGAKYGGEGPNAGRRQRWSGSSIGASTASPVVSISACGSACFSEMDGEAVISASSDGVEDADSNERVDLECRLHNSCASLEDADANGTVTTFSSKKSTEDRVAADAECRLHEGCASLEAQCRGLRNRIAAFELAAETYNQTQQGSAACQACEDCRSRVQALRSEVCAARATLHERRAVQEFRMAPPACAEVDSETSRRRFSDAAPASKMWLTVRVGAAANVSGGSDGSTCASISDDGASCPASPSASCRLLSTGAVISLTPREQEDLSSSRTDACPSHECAACDFRICDIAIGQAGCPAGHGLVELRVSGDGATTFCDACNGRQPRGGLVYGCRPCNFDLCPSCVRDRFIPPASVVSSSARRPAALSPTRCGFAHAALGVGGDPTRRSPTSQAIVHYSSTISKEAAISLAAPTPTIEMAGHSASLLPAVCADSALTSETSRENKEAPPRVQRRSPPSAMSHSVSCFSLPLTYRSFLHLHNTVAMPLMQRSEDLGRALQYLNVANDMHVRLCGRPSAEALYNMACCLSLAAEAAAVAPAPGAPPHLKTHNATEAQFDIIASILDAAVNAGYTNMVNAASDNDLAAFRQARPVQLAGIISRMEMAQHVAPGFVASIAGISTPVAPP